jgi:hypothetical protein
LRESIFCGGRVAQIADRCKALLTRDGTSRRGWVSAIGLTASQCLVVSFAAIQMDWDNSHWVELRQYVRDLKEPFS